MNCSIHTIGERMLGKQNSAVTRTHIMDYFTHIVVNHVICLDSFTDMVILIYITRPF